MTHPQTPTNIWFWSFQVQLVFSCSHRYLLEQKPIGSGTWLDTLVPPPLWDVSLSNTVTHLSPAAHAAVKPQTIYYFNTVYELHTGPQVPELREEQVDPSSTFHMAAEATTNQILLKQTSKRRQKQLVSPVSVTGVWHFSLESRWQVTRHVVCVPSRKLGSLSLRHQHQVWALPPLQALSQLSHESCESVLHFLLEWGKPQNWFTDKSISHWCSDRTGAPHVLCAFLYISFPIFYLVLLENVLLFFV